MPAFSLYTLQSHHIITVNTHSAHETRTGVRLTGRKEPLRTVRDRLGGSESTLCKCGAFRAPTRRIPRVSMHNIRKGFR